jgi:hypothetical protein
MVAGVSLALMLSAAAVDSTPRLTGPRLDADRAGVVAAPDTVRPRKKAFVLSESYETRLRIHKVASYAMLPLFAAQYAAGDQLFKKGSAAPGWARGTHGALATSVAGLFGVNTLTGGLNWWETRGQDGGRGWRTAHAVLLLAADAGFTVTGLLADDAEDSGSLRRQHRNAAMASMAVATVGYVMMLPPFRRD